MSKVVVSLNKTDLPHNIETWIADQEPKPTPTQIEWALWFYKWKMYEKQLSAADTTTIKTDITNFVTSMAEAAVPLYMRAGNIAGKEMAELGSKIGNMIKAFIYKQTVGKIKCWLYKTSPQCSGAPASSDSGSDSGAGGGDDSDAGGGNIKTIFKNLIKKLEPILHKVTTGADTVITQTGGRGKRGRERGRGIGHRTIKRRRKRTQQAIRRIMNRMTRSNRSFSRSYARASLP